MPNNKHPSPNPIKFFAHRGHCIDLPENSLPAFEAAIQLGAPAIELDVHLVENTLIVFHDKTLDRVTHQSGKLTNFSLQQLTNTYLSDHPDITIPTLENVFSKIAGKITINVELKGPNTATKTVELINHYCEQHNCTPNDFLISSFEHEQLEKTRQLSTTIPIGILTRKPSANDHQLATKLKAHSYHVNIQRLTHKFIDSAHQNGLKVYTYPIDDLNTIQQAKQLNCDAIFIKNTKLAQEHWHTEA